MEAGQVVAYLLDELHLLIPEVATGKRVGGYRRLEQGASLGLFRPNTAEARDRSTGPLTMCACVCGGWQAGSLPPRGSHARD
uniref:Uncharacterized protein n=1 Tax=Catagonus wagneri TaxID=51154 RepID=A0A8C3WJL6_9CETA